MTAALAERTLVGLLVDDGSLSYLARVGLPPEVVPTEQLRDVVAWALAYHRDSRRAPTVAVVRERWGDLLSDHGVDLDAEPAETVEWAVATLRSAYVRWQSATCSRRLVTAVSEADEEDRVEVFQRMAAEIAAVAMRLQPATAAVDMRHSGRDVLDRYDALLAEPGQIRGLALGLPMIDDYTRGIWPGELALVAAGPATGKSYLLNYIALREWERGRVPALYTLENSIEMTQLRIACLALHLSSEEMERGELSDTDYKRLVEWVNDVLAVADNPLLIFAPDGSMRTPQSVVAQARAYQADSLIVDQLTFMEAAEVGRNDARHGVLRTITHDLHVLIGTGDPLPCVLAHQVNREGVKYAEKTGRMEMYHMAEGAEVERTVDWLFALYASHDQRATGRLSFQTLKARRKMPLDFDLLWDIGTGSIAARAAVGA